MRKRLITHFALVSLAIGLVLLWLLHGSNRGRVAPSAPRMPTSGLSISSVEQDQIKRSLALEAERRQVDQSVWALELLAEKHEDVFIKLWDDLRTQQDKAAVLAQFPFGELILGDPGQATNLDHGIRTTRLREPGERLTSEAWHNWLHKFTKQGYQLVDSEWRHARFDPGADGHVQSTMALTLHVSNPERQERVIVRGNFGVTWRENPDPNGLPFPEQLDATGLELVSQSGPPAFERVLAKEIQTELNPVFIDPLILYDLDGDGLSEIILVGQNLVYLNHGRGVFQAGKLCQEPIPTINTAIIADFTGDGLPDVLAADRDGLILFAGDGKGPFTGPARRIPFTAAELPNAFVMTAGDVDGDGALDIWLAQYKLPYVAGQMPTPYYDANDGFPSFLLLNDGHGNFRDATAESGLAKKRFRRTYSASFVDLDNDGDLDLVVVSDFAGVDLYYNDGHGHFTDVTESALDEPHAFGMAHTFGDFDRNGQLDFLVIGRNSFTAQRLDQLGLGPSEFPEYQAMRPKMDYGNRLYLRRGEGWQQTALSDQVARSGWSWGVTSFDFDNDGRLDLYIANGHKSRNSVKDYDTQFWRHDIYVAHSTHDPVLDLYFRAVADRLYGAGSSWGGHEKNRLFLNQDGKAFLEIGLLAGVAMPEDCRDVVSDDLDADGKLDLIVTTLEIWPQPRQALHIFHNRLSDAGNWIGFQLRESRPGFSPVGAKVTLTTPSGTQLRHIVTGDSYRSQHANTVHFGIGKDTNVIEAEIRWPNGTPQRFENPAINEYHRVIPPPEHP